MDAILSHDWPGNVRELRNRLERAAILTAGDLIRPEHLGLVPEPPRCLETRESDPAHTAYRLSVPTEQLSLAALTSQILAQTLEQCHGNKSKAAHLLKIDRKMFYRD